MDHLPQDLRLALRRLRNSPGATVTAVAVLALGLGATTALFSIVHAVLLEPLPYPEASRIYRLQELDRQTGEEEDNISSPIYQDWRAGLASFSALTAILFDNSNLTGASEPQQLRVARVSQDFFAVFEPALRLGRVFTATENSASAENLIILGHGVWQRQFGGLEEAIGSVVELDSQPYTVIGVMSAGFQFPAWADVWAPLGEGAGDGRDQRALQVYGLLGQDSDPVVAAAEFDTMARRLSAAHPATHQDIGAKLRPLLEEEVGEVRPTLLMLFGAVVGVLLIVCLNVAGLQLARGLGQRRELALRTALGAGRGRVIQQLMTESLLLATLGGGVGLLFAH